MWSPTRTSGPEDCLAEEACLAEGARPELKSGPAFLETRSAAPYRRSSLSSTPSRLLLCPKATGEQQAPPSPFTPMPSPEKCLLLPFLVHPEPKIRTVKWLGWKLS